MFFFFFFNDTATTEIYTLSLHDALPISVKVLGAHVSTDPSWVKRFHNEARAAAKLKNPHTVGRSEEHTSELQSQSNLVCRLLLEKKKKATYKICIKSTEIARMYSASINS